jgi:diguanylate cyclase (GGDEF)-like protein
MVSGRTPRRRNPDRPGEPASGNAEDGATVVESNTQGSSSQPATDPADAHAGRTTKSAAPSGARGRVHARRVAAAEVGAVRAAISTNAATNGALATPAPAEALAQPEAGVPTAAGPVPTPAHREPTMPPRPTRSPATVHGYVRARPKVALGIVRAHRPEEDETSAAASVAEPVRPAVEPLSSNEGIFRRQATLEPGRRALFPDPITGAMSALRAAGTAFGHNASARLSSLKARPDSVPPPDLHRTVRPVLLMLVLGAFLVIVGATATGQAALVTADSSATILNTTVNADAAAVRIFVGLNLSQADLEPGGLGSDRRAALQHSLRLLTDSGGILHAALLAPDGTVLASDDGAGVGKPAPLTQELTSAVQNLQAAAAIVGPDDAGALAPLTTDSVLREYLPIINQGRVYATVAVWRDGAPILAQLEQGRIRVVVITLTAALVSALLLFFIFWAAQQRLTRQTLQLLEAARRDPLTGALNHGSLVEALTSQVDAARAGGRAIGVALLDLDNFGLLDNTYGHLAGDHVLIEVVRLLASLMPPGVTWGRYGPDEFLVMTAAGDEATLKPTVERLQATLADETLQFEDSERLPVSFSAGLCFYPTNGDSVTTLLSMAAMTLDEAKASGGDAICVAEARPPVPGHVKTFNILEGLVIAIDTKDRYTRRHSEDVARCADFLARRLALDPNTRRAIRSAGKLHDIGKIGIPDTILRKPGRLSHEEYAIVRQHVELGDLIVRDLPDIDLIRAGIRHHHERWDGQGYPGGLAAEEIPLVARILAVGDSFSGMTTTRPYRKALSVQVALKRLEDAAGSQLDARLVEIFVRGIRSVADAPLPAEPTPVSAVRALLVPGRQVA